MKNESFVKNFIAKFNSQLLLVEPPKSNTFVFVFCLKQSFIVYSFSLVVSWNVNLIKFMRDLECVYKIRIWISFRFECRGIPLNMPTVNCAVTMFTRYVFSLSFWTFKVNKTINVIIKMNERDDMSKNKWSSNPEKNWSIHVKNFQLRSIFQNFP